MSMAVLPAPMTMQRSATAGRAGRRLAAVRGCSPVAASRPGASSSSRPRRWLAARPMPRNTASYSSCRGAERQVVAETRPWRSSIPPILRRNRAGRSRPPLVAGDAVVMLRPPAWRGPRRAPRRGRAWPGGGRRTARPARRRPRRCAFAGGRRALERMFAEASVVEGVALQLADQHRWAFLGVVAYVSAGEDFRGADAGAAAAEDVRREDLLRRALTFSWRCCG